MNTKKHIPEIYFKERGSSLSGFELIYLKELLNRNVEELGQSLYKPHRINFNAILIIESGRAIHKVDFKEYTLSKGNCLIISEGQIHAFNEKYKYDGYLILFTESFLLKYVSNSVLNKILRLYDFDLNTSKYYNEIQNSLFINGLKNEISNHNEFAKEDIIASLLSIYLLKLENENLIKVQNNKYGSNYEIFKKFKLLLHNKYADTRNAQDYAKYLAFTYKHLNSICKIFTKKTAKAYIDDYVILEIKRLLSSTNLTIKEICYKCGFDEPTNFHKYFTKHTGISPTSFKKQI